MAITKKKTLNIAANKINNVNKVNENITEEKKKENNTKVKKEKVTKSKVTKSKVTKPKVTKPKVTNEKITNEKVTNNLIIEEIKKNNSIKNNNSNETIKIEKTKVNKVTKAKVKKANAINTKVTKVTKKNTTNAKVKKVKKETKVTNANEKNANAIKSTTKKNSGKNKDKKRKNVEINYNKDIPQDSIINDVNYMSSNVKKSNFKHYNLKLNSLNKDLKSYKLLKHLETLGYPKRNYYAYTSYEGTTFVNRKPISYFTERYKKKHIYPHQNVNISCNEKCVELFKKSYNYMSQLQQQLFNKNIENYISGGAGYKLYSNFSDVENTEKIFTTKDFDLYLYYK